MKAAWRSLGLLCLVTALCLVIWIGPSALPMKAESCTEAIADGGFETGDVWQLGATPVVPEYVTDPVHSGAQALALGIVQGTNVVSYSSARQVVKIPAGAAEARLSFWFQAEGGDSTGADKMQLVLLNPDGSTLAVLWTSSSDNPSWSRLTFDVTQWRGRAVQVYFNVINDGTGGTTGMFLDDVSLAVCADTVSAAETALPAASDDVQSAADPEPSITPSGPLASGDEQPGTDLETPAMIFLTPEADSSSSQEAPPVLATPEAPEVSEVPSPNSGTPALIFFTPTVDEMAPQASLLDSSTLVIPSASEAGTPGLQLTRVSLPVTPPLPIMPRSTVNAVSQRTAPGTPAPPTSDQGLFTEWPKGWWFAVGAVFAVILALSLFAWRPG